MRGPLRQSQPLRALLDLPLKHPEFAEKEARAFELLDERCRAESGDKDLAITTFEDAISLVERLIEEVEGAMEETQRAEMSMKDPNELRREIEQKSRRDADRIVQELARQWDEIGRDWSSRARRQSERIRQEALTSGKRELVLAEHPEKEGLTLSIDETWWPQFTGYVAGCCDAWIADSREGLEMDLEECLRARAESLDNIADVAPFSPPDAGRSPLNESDLEGEEIPRQKVEIPTLGASLFGFVRTNIMSVGIFATALAVVGVFAAQYMGMMGKGERVNTMLVRGAVVVLIIPPSVLFGYFAARKQRAKLRDKAIKEQREKIISFLQKSLQRVFKRQLDAIERGHEQRIKQWSRALEQWREGPVEDALRERAESMQEEVHTLRLEQGKLRDRYGKLRSLRGKLEDNVLFELRRQERELLQGD